MVKKSTYLTKVPHMKKLKCCFVVPAKITKVEALEKAKPEHVGNKRQVMQSSLSIILHQCPVVEEQE